MECVPCSFLSFLVLKTQGIGFFAFLFVWGVDFDFVFSSMNMFIDLYFISSYVHLCVLCESVYRQVQVPEEAKREGRILWSWH